jgi:hypothetical protein
MDEELILKTDISDWAEEVRKLNPELGSKDKAIETQQRLGLSTQIMGRLIVAARAMGLAEELLIPIVKLLIQIGAARAWSSTLERRVVTGETPSGKKIVAREFIGPIERSGEPWVPVYNPKAIKRTMHYLREVVPGHIKSRFNILAVNGISPFDIGEELKATIDELVGEFL